MLVAIPDDRKCAECGSRLNGRSDQKFCNDSCRTSFHNRLNQDKTRAFNRVQAILKRNRSILEKFFLEGKLKVPLPLLIASGYRPQFHTHATTMDGRCLAYFCYDFGYIENSDLTVTLLIENL